MSIISNKLELKVGSTLLLVMFYKTTMWMVDSSARTPANGASVLVYSGKKYGSRPANTGEPNWIEWVKCHTATVTGRIHIHDDSFNSIRYSIPSSSVRSFKTLPSPSPLHTHTHIPTTAGNPLSSAIMFKFATSRSMATALNASKVLLPPPANEETILPLCFCS